MSRPDLGGKFQTFIFDGREADVAKTITPYNLMYLQNKVAAYAAAVVEFSYDPANPNHFSAILEHEKLKAQVSVLEELITEFQVPNHNPTPSNPEGEN